MVLGWRTVFFGCLYQISSSEYQTPRWHLPYSTRPTTQRHHCSIHCWVWLASPWNLIREFPCLDLQSQVIKWVGGERANPDGGWKGGELFDQHSLGRWQPFNLCRQVYRSNNRVSPFFLIFYYDPLGARGMVRKLLNYLRSFKDYN